ncbi:mitochondrial membrane protein [Trichoderma virens]|nr:mitochondrial membrane protein [Trichoderma virens]
MVTELPYALDAETPLNPSELSVLRAQFEKEGEMVGVQTKFNYAWVRSPLPPKLLSHPSRNKNSQMRQKKRASSNQTTATTSNLASASSPTSSASPPERRRECLYYLALGNYKLGNYGEARRYNDLLLDREPANLQATDLRQLIDDKVAKEGLLGVAIISGIGIAAGVVGAFFAAECETEVKLANMKRH